MTESTATAPLVTAPSRLRPRVVITGIGAVTPLGVGARPLYAGRASGRCGISDGVGRCEDFNPAPARSSKEPSGTDLGYVPAKARPLVSRQNGAGPRPAVAISNSFGFGGHNAVLCLGAAA